MHPSQTNSNYCNPTFAGLNQYSKVNENLFEPTILQESLNEFYDFGLISITAAVPYYSVTILVTDQDFIDMEMKAYEEKKEDYLKQYEGEYIALLNGKFLGHDKDFSELAKRIYDEYGYEENYFFPFVTRAEKSFKLSSPKFISNKLL